MIAAATTKNATGRFFNHTLPATSAARAAPPISERRKLRVAQMR